MLSRFTAVYTVRVTLFCLPTNAPPQVNDPANNIYFSNGLRTQQLSISVPGLVPTTVKDKFITPETYGQDFQMAIQDLGINGVNPNVVNVTVTTQNVDVARVIHFIIHVFVG